MIPVGAVLCESSRHTKTLSGMVGLYWERRHYSICVNDLLKKAEPVQVPEQLVHAPLLDELDHPARIEIDAKADAAAMLA
jgi:hypothetical protein